GGGIGSGFAEVIPARPDDLAGHVGVPIQGGEHLARGGAEVGRIEFICAYLTALRISARPVPNRRTDPRFHRKEIRSASAVRCGGFAAEDRFLRKLLAEGRVLRRCTVPREIGE